MDILKRILILLIAAVPAIGFSYECDTGELRRVLPKEMTQKILKDAVTDYLFEEKNLNSTPEKYTTVYQRATKTFYLNRGRLIAVLDQISPKELLLTRLNKSCQPFEMVSFTSLDPQKSSAVRYKITPKFCRMVVDQKNRFPASTFIEESQSFLSDLKDRTTQKGVKRDCQLLKQSPAAPNKRKIANARD